MKIWPLIVCATFASLCHAAPVTYTTTLSGSIEVPVNASAGTGAATVTIDTVAHTLFVSIQFSGLTGTTTASHVHCCTAISGVGTAGVATATPFFPGFPIGVTSGTYSQTFDTTLNATWNGAFITANSGTAAGAEAAFATGLSLGEPTLTFILVASPPARFEAF